MIKNQTYFKKGKNSYEKIPTRFANQTVNTQITQPFPAKAPFFYNRIKKRTSGSSWADPPTLKFAPTAEVTLLARSAGTTKKRRRRARILPIPTQYEEVSKLFITVH